MQHVNTALRELINGEKGTAAIIEEFELSEAGPRDGDSFYVITCKRSWLILLTAAVEQSAPALHRVLAASLK